MEKHSPQCATPSKRWGPAVPIRRRMVKASTVHFGNREKNGDTVGGVVEVKRPFSPRAADAGSIPGCGAAVSSAGH